MTSEGDHDVGSSMLKIKNIVNFGWEHKYYPGQLVAAHMSGTYIAYAITTPGKGCGVVRVAVLLVNLDQNIGLGKNQIIGDISCFPAQIQEVLYKILGDLSVLKVNYRRF